jgi:hypothetical protein
VFAKLVVMMSAVANAPSTTIPIAGIPNLRMDGFDTEDLLWCSMRNGSENELGRGGLILAAFGRQQGADSQ